LHLRADVLAHGVSDRGVLRQHYETDALDASTLLAGSFNFLAHDDKRLRNTVLAVAEELTENGFVLRYPAPTGRPVVERAPEHADICAVSDLDFPSPTAA
jgi:GH15 family glucan-1,4-alpha-glucosidase